MVTVAGRPLVAGRAEGEVRPLDEPLSFWGGFDSENGTIIDQRHPQRGIRLTGTIVVMPAGRGSSSASSVLAESIRRGTAPLAIVMHADDEIVALGAIVADELYGTTMPVVVVEGDDYELLAAARTAEITVDGEVIIG